MKNRLLDVRELWISLALEIEPPLEKVSNTSDISIEIELGVRMGSAHHLRKIDKSDTILVV